MSDYSEMYERAKADRRRFTLLDIVLTILAGALIGMAICYALLLDADASESPRSARSGRVVERSHRG